MMEEVELNPKKKDEKKEDALEYYTDKLYAVARLLRVDFSAGRRCTPRLVINAIVTSIMFTLGCYCTAFTARLTFAEKHTPMEISSQLLLVTWAFQALCGLVFFVDWQYKGLLSGFTQRLRQSHERPGIQKGKYILRRNVVWFYCVLIAEIVVMGLYCFKFYIEETHSAFVAQQAKMFYFEELRFFTSVITLYLYIVWAITMFIYVIYTNAAFLEVKFFNDQLEQIDGTAGDLASVLVEQMTVYGKLTAMIRQLDEIFRFYSFVMLATIIPSVIFTLMMLNERIHGWSDFILCLPSISLSLISFLAVTISPARLHDEVNRSKTCLVTNHTVWAPFRKEIYQISGAFLSHMEQYDLGISVWGFATLSRPLILATFSVMTMVLSLIIELSPPPQQHALEHH